MVLISNVSVRCRNRQWLGISFCACLAATKEAQVNRICQHQPQPMASPPSHGPAPPTLLCTQQGCLLAEQVKEALSGDLSESHRGLLGDFRMQEQKCPRCYSAQGFLEEQRQSNNMHTMGGDLSSNQSRAYP